MNDDRQPNDCPNYVNKRINEHPVSENVTDARLLMTCIDELEREWGLEREIEEARARETHVLVDQIQQELENLKNDIKSEKSENNYLRAEFEKYRSENLQLVASTKQQLAEMRARIEAQARELELLTEKYSRSEEKLGEFERHTRKEREELQRNVEEQTRDLGAKVKRVREIVIQTEMQNWGEFVWPINWWVALRQSATESSCKEIFSDAFYSHKNGYKMCLSVYPGGCNAGKGTHLSAYFYLMRGPFDNILSWPFKRDVTLSLINQHTGIDHVSVTVTFDMFPNDINWNKPVTERNGRFGTPKLIELGSISSNAQLYRDDKIFIRCIVK